MKKSIIILAVFVLSFSLIGCESIGTENVVSGLIKGVATFADAKKAADSLTPENEYYLGRAVAANIAGIYEVDRSPALQTYLNKICSTIVINSPRPDIFSGYHVAILKTNEINAFATPGGHIFVTRGLIACASNEDALASVIAHEIAHIQLQHALTSIRNARYVNAAVSGTLAGVGEAAGGGLVSELTGIMSESVNEIITTMVVKGFSKKDELEADETALSLLASAGYQPSGLMEMLDLLKEKQGNDKTKGFGKTHPTPAERITAANKVIGKYKVDDTRSYRTNRYGVATR
jgi:predicted Zn-dependent protease